MTMQSPAAQLSAPQADPLIPPTMDAFLHIGDLVSLGHWAIVAIDQMGGPNIAAEIGEWFAGDWSEVMRSADALNNLAAFCESASSGLDDELATMMAGWQGEAASSAASYFGQLAGELGTQAANFRDIASQYESTAFGVEEMANAVGSLVESLADYAIAAGISLAAAAASSWTVIGGILGGGAAAYSILKGAQTIKLILDLRAKVWVACEALMGLIAGSLSAIDGFQAVALPSAYNNTTVA